MALFEVNWKPPPKQLRGFGIACLVVFGAIGLWIYLKHGFFGFEFSPETSNTSAYVLGSVAATAGILSAVAPQALRWLYVVLTVITLPIGFVISHVIMAIVFYLIFSPIGLLFRLINRDALKLKPDRDGTTYWVRREPVKDVKRYYRQF